MVALEQIASKKKTSVPVSEERSIKRGQNTETHQEVAVNPPKVFMYHRIVDDAERAKQQDNCVYAGDFHKQLEFLDRLGYTPVTFKDYELFQHGELIPPKKPIILTFDDGYMDFYEIAYPLLQEYGMKAVVFVLGDRRIKTNIWDEDKKNMLMAPLMNDEHILELHSKGFEIGAHSLSHANLSELETDEAYNEIIKSKIILEGLLDDKVKSFSYPFGAVNSKIKNKVAEAGYQFACSVYSGPPQFFDDYFEIRRIAIHNSTNMLSYAFKSLAPYEYMEWLWWKAQSGN